MFTQGRFLLRISRHTHGFSITRMYFDLRETIAAYITVGDAYCVPESSFRFARNPLGTVFNLTLRLDVRRGPIDISRSYQGPRSKPS
jgi:hypothetical protein